MKTFIIFIVLSTLIRCEGGGIDIEIRNNSQQDIVEFSYITEYPDTIPTRREPTYYGIIPPSSGKYETYGYADSLEDLFEIRGDTISFFFMSPDTIKKYGWEDVRKNYRILRRYDLSYSDVKLLEYIPYPPTPAMRYMKMYPPYEE